MASMRCKGCAYLRLARLNQSLVEVCTIQDNDGVNKSKCHRYMYERKNPYGGKRASNA